MNFLLENFERDKEEYKKSYGKLGRVFKNSVIAVGVPTYLTAIGSQIFEDNTQLLPSLAIAAIATISNFNLIKKNRNPSYASYLIDIKGKANQIPNIASQYLHEFIND